MSLANGQLGTPQMVEALSTRVPSEEKPMRDTKHEGGRNLCDSEPLRWRWEMFVTVAVHSLP